MHDYEQLRGTIAGNVEGRGHGWSALLRRGMAAWMELTGSEDAAPKKVPARSEESSKESNRSELVTLLADMALGSTRKEQLNYGKQSESHSRLSKARRLLICKAVDSTAGSRKHGEHQAPICFATKVISLGWPAERITVIDSDLGLSGAQSEGREGFQHLVAEAGLGNAGLIMGLEFTPGS